MRPPVRAYSRYGKIAGSAWRAASREAFHVPGIEGITLKLDYLSAYLLILTSLIIGTPFFIVFGWLSDRIGRLKLILVGCLIAALTYLPLFAALTHYANPDLEAFSDRNSITVVADGLT